MNDARVDSYLRRVELDGTIDTIAGPPKEYVHVPEGYAETNSWIDEVQLAVSSA